MRKKHRPGTSTFNTVAGPYWRQWAHSALRVLRGFVADAVTGVAAAAHSIVSTKILRLHLSSGHRALQSISNVGHRLAIVGGQALCHVQKTLSTHEFKTHGFHYLEEPQMFQSM